ncbi:hypothetical protein DFJ73DRAFT_801041 [Zopfochytrium polystomum]|nr:hypothetical protein DFJ73DRAFT_801041 [Zopfochytrium polystomum]
MAQAPTQNHTNAIRRRALANRHLSSMPTAPNNRFNIPIAFASGGVLGIVASWFYFRDRYIKYTELPQIDVNQAEAQMQEDKARAQVNFTR